MVRTMIANRISFARESTLTAKFDFQVMQMAREAGYAIHLTYVRLETPELAISRVRSRVQQGGHDVPEADMRRRYRRSLENLPRAFELVDDYVLLDNSEDGYRFIEEGQGDA
ncbi:MAG: zeta toxin family protein [Desulfovibrio sp.]|nr:zeta toxin family protein [Desulfovibrio sp.]MBR5050155.1 zeta toxin family protein [Desulfovibrio sp.]MBR6468369.1 zeta toxin family protein [Desulfovibrio sp.]